MYSPAARGVRRCNHLTASGQLCRSYSVWGDPEGRCASHGGKRQGPRRQCTCAAYKWPHRPGGGLCRWPDPPTATSPTAEGKHAPRGKRKPTLHILRHLPPGRRPKLGRPAMLRPDGKPLRVVTTRHTYSPADLLVRAANLLKARDKFYRRLNRQKLNDAKPD